MELEACSFIKSYLPFGKEKKESLYRLVDEYSKFYFEFSPHKNNAGSFIYLSQSSKFKAWSGYAFESLCMKHIPSINKALGINGIFTTESSFYYKGTTRHKGFQIDLLIDRNDNSINLCEMKFYNSPYEITKKDSLKLLERKEQFRKISSTKKYLINTMITTHGIRNNQYSLSIEMFFI